MLAALLALAHPAIAGDGKPSVVGLVVPEVVAVKPRLLLQQLVEPAVALMIPRQVAGASKLRRLRAAAGQPVRRDRAQVAVLEVRVLQALPRG